MNSSMVPKGKKPPKPISGGPVRLDAWVAATQPRLHPTQRKVLQAVSELAAGGAQVTSSVIREQLGISQQLLNRHLRGLESEGLVHLESLGVGLPLLARATSLGQRALGLRGPQAATKPEQEKIPAAPMGRDSDEPEPPTPATGEHEAPRSRLKHFMDQLFNTLSPYLAGLNKESFQRLVSQAMAEAMDLAARPGQGLPPVSAVAPVVPPPAPRPSTAAPAIPGPADLPELNPAELALEDRLSQTAHLLHRRHHWWERTREFSNIWDQTRRHRIGVLGTFFNTFGPRWQHPDWESFNRARRQADARGAAYQDWVDAQFNRLAGKGRGEVAPEELQGEEAAQAWQALRQAETGGHPAVAGPPPYTPESFNIHNPDHAAYAEELLDEIGFLASRVYGDDPDGPIRLLAQAVDQGTLPRAALDLRPEWKERVLAVLGAPAWPRSGPAFQADQCPVGGPPPVII